MFDVYIGDRKRKEMGDIDDLAIDMRDNGQITPITIRPPTPEELEEGVKEPWVLSAGGRRYLAAMKIGWTRIAAFIRHDIQDALTHRVIELHENLKRLELTWQEQADMKREILRLRQTQDPDITPREVAWELGDNPSSFSRDVDVSKAMEQQPQLRKAASRKSALRARDLAAQLEARMKADERNREAITSVKDRVVVSDALDFLQQFDDRFDICITDPPYGIEYFKGGQKDSKGEDTLSGYDDSVRATAILYSKLFPALARSMRDTGWVLLFGSAESVPLMREVWQDTCCVHYGRSVSDTSCENSFGDNESCKWFSPEIVPWIWYRPNSRNSPRFPERTARNMYEYILVVNMGAALLARPTENVFVFDAVYDETRIHVNQKPVDLIKSLLEHIGFPGDNFCDPMCGSGSHLAAAASLGMNVFGCDNNEAMLPIAHGMIAKHFKEVPPSVRDLAEARYKQRLAAISFDAQAPVGRIEDVPGEGLAEPVDSDGREEEGSFNQP